MSSSDLKNVVIIGAAHAGGYAARALAKTLPATHRIVLLDSSDHAYWNVAGLRASVVPGEEEKIFRDLATFWPAGSRHVVRPSTRVKELAEDHILTDSGERIDFDYAVIATGAGYATPGRTPAGKKTEAKAALQALQAQVKAAQHILVVGAGPVGVEFAGEVTGHYGGGKKRVTLVGNSKQLVGDAYSASLHSKLLSQMKKAQVKVILQDSLDLSSLSSRNTGPIERKTLRTQNGVEIPDVDFVFFAFAGKPNSGLAKAADPSCVDEETGDIKVDPSTLRVQSRKLNRYFAVGDVTNLPGGKLSMQVNPAGDALAANLGALIKANGKTDQVSFKAFKPMPKRE